MSRTHGRGFTLIELMITVAIVAILASIAYPSYRSYVLKSKRAEGRAALTQLLQEQERYMAQRNAYEVITPPGNQTVPFKTFAGDKLAGSPYLLGAERCNPDPNPGQPLRLCVRVTAAPQHADPEAGTLWVESTGNKGCDGSKTTVCWK